MARLDITPPSGGPTAEVWITLAWNGALIAAALAASWLIMLVLNFVLLPFLPGRLWKRPWCWLFGHIEGEDFDISDRGWVEICTRCGRAEPTEEA